MADSIKINIGSGTITVKTVKEAEEIMSRMRGRDAHGKMMTRQAREAGILPRSKTNSQLTPWQGRRPDPKHKSNTELVYSTEWRKHG